MYEIVISEKADKELDKLPAKVADKILDKIEILATDPKPRKHKKLTNFHVANVTGDLYRIRIGDYRAIYTIEDEILRVLVVKVAHRKEVYE